MRWWWRLSAIEPSQCYIQTNGPEALISGSFDTPDLLWFSAAATAGRIPPLVYQARQNSAVPDGTPLDSSSTER